MVYHSRVTGVKTYNWDTLDECRGMLWKEKTEAINGKEEKDGRKLRWNTPLRIREHQRDTFLSASSIESQTL
ncbi:hypothetical protein R3I94_014534 [Phoxinus phoxinus]